MIDLTDDSPLTGFWLWFARAGAFVGIVALLCLMFAIGPLLLAGLYGLIASAFG